MKPNTRKLAVLALIPAALITCTSCKSLMPGKEASAIVETRNGAMVVDTFTTAATVAAIDAANRKITLTFPNGKKSTFKAGTGVNLDQLHTGDVITVNATEEVAVFLRKPGTPASVGEGTVFAEAARGRESEVLTAGTVEVTAKIAVVDTKQHMVSLQFSDGTFKTLKVSKHVDLAQVKVGDEVTAQVAESVAIMVQKA